MKSQLVYVKPLLKKIKTSVEKLLSFQESFDRSISICFSSFSELLLENAIFDCIFICIHLAIS